MKRAVVVVVVTLLSALFLVLDNATAASEEDATVLPDNGTVTVSLRNYRESDVFKSRLTLAASSAVTISVEDVPSDIWFVVLQVHTYQYNTTLSYEKTLLDRVSNGSLFGSNIGLYLNTRNATQIPMRMFLRHDNVHNLDALLAVVPYGRYAPIPGGCNMEFEIEVAPYQKLRTANEMITVDAQPASVLPDGGSTTPFACERNPVRHRMYRFYLPEQNFSPETYFEAIAGALTVRDIVRNGVEIPPALTTSSMRRVYSTYIGTGSVYAVIATYENYSSAYVPTFTYACSPLLYRESCYILNDTFSKVICSLVLFLGFFISISIAPKYHSVDRLSSSFVMGGFIGYALAVAAGNAETAINVLIGTVLALFTACVSTYLHNRLSERPLYILLCNLQLGFLCAGIAYLYAPARMFYLLENDWLFWPTVMSLMFAVATLATLLSVAGDGETIVRAVFGPFLMIIAIDYYNGTNLKYIFITFVRRLTVSGFQSAFVQPPFQGSDIINVVAWIIMIILQFIKLSCAHRRTNSFANGENQSLLPRHDSRNWQQLRRWKWFRVTRLSARNDL